MILFVLLIPIMMSNSIQSQNQWTMDASHSNILFTAPHMVGAVVGGRFTEFNGTVTGSKEDFTDARAEVTIQVTRINTNNGKRNEHLRSADFFDASK